MNPHDYNITVRQVHDEDGACFEARVRELPDVAEHGETFQEAYELAIDTIETTAEALADQGRRMPEPVVPNDDYSGRITVRVPRSLHRDLASAADEEGVSLNQLIASALGMYVGVRGSLSTVGAFLGQYEAVVTGGTAIREQPEAVATRPNLRVVRDNTVHVENGWGNTG